MPASAMETTTASTQQHIEAMTRQQPSLEPLLAAFGRMQAAVEACRASLPAFTALASPDPALLEKGVPLLEQMPSGMPDLHLALAGESILPAVAEAFPALADAAAVCGAALAQGTFCRQCEDLLGGRPTSDLERLAKDHGLTGHVLAFLLQQLTRPALEAFAASAAPGLQETPWTLWNKGHCPVCGAAPSMSMLQLGPQEPNEYLKNVSAQRWLCCPTCAHTWRISRTLCPSCGHDEHEEREYFNVEGHPLERVELCRHCKHYLLTVDMRERISALDHRLAPYGLVHLDILAQRRGYRPQNPLPWNTLSEGLD